MASPTLVSKVRRNVSAALIWEAKMIAEADADIAAGRLIDEADIDA